MRPVSHSGVSTGFLETGILDPMLGWPGVISFGVLGVLLLGIGIVFLIAPRGLVRFVDGMSSGWPSLSRYRLASTVFRIRYAGVLEIVGGLACLWGALFHLAEI
jgi:hypothetical protein